MREQTRWETIPGYSRYEVSDLGEVRNAKTGKRISQFDRRNNGYLYVGLVRDDGRGQSNLAVHRLVASAFVENPDSSTKTQVNHKKECKHDNRACNLEWMTCSENNRYGTARQRRADKESMPVVMVYKGLSVMFNSAADAELRTGIPAKSIQKCCSGKLLSTHGATFAYFGAKVVTDDGASGR